MKFLASFLLIVFINACSYPSLSSEQLADSNNNPESILKIWALSDIQPRAKSQRLEFSKAIEDIDSNISDIDFVIVGGDLVNRAKRGEFEWYLETRERSSVKEWHEIAGNHDLKSDNGKLYKQIINPVFHYSFSKGNILFIMMSDEQKGSPTEISEETFVWWKGLVAANQDKIIVVVSHAPVEGSGIPMSETRRRRITDSKRFREVLKKYHVDVWLNGHVHVPHWFADNVIKNESLGGTVFVNLAAIRTEAFGVKSSESRMISFTCDSNQFRVRSRNHTNGSFNSSLESVFELSKPYLCDGEGFSIEKGTKFDK